MYQLITERARELQVQEGRLRGGSHRSALRIGLGAQLAGVPGVEKDALLAEQ
jgi:hypothetical protein